MVQLHCNPLKEAYISTIEQRKVKLSKLGKRLTKPIKEFIEDDMASYAAALSFWVFSLFPFILFLVALLSFVGIPGFFDWLVERAQTVMPEQAMGQVEESVGRFALEPAVGCSPSWSSSPCGRLPRRFGWPCTPLTSPTTSRKHAQRGNGFRCRSSTLYSSQPW